MVDTNKQVVRVAAHVKGKRIQNVVGRILMKDARRLGLVECHLETADYRIELVAIAPPVMNSVTVDAIKMYLEGLKDGTTRAMLAVADEIRADRKSDAEAEVKIVWVRCRAAAAGRLDIQRRAT